MVLTNLQFYLGKEMCDFWLCCVSSTLSLALMPGGSVWLMPCIGCLTSGNDLAPTVKEVGWVPGPVWRGVENLTATEIRSQDCPAQLHPIAFH